MRKRQAAIALALTANSLLCVDALAQALASASSPASASSAGSLLLVELVKALAWPVVALVLAGAFRRPITQFVGALGSRITKLSLFKVLICT